MTEMELAATETVVALRWRDMDAYGHVNHVVYLTYLEEARDAAIARILRETPGEGGYVVPPDVFHVRLRELTRKHGMLLVVDEVQSGMGRTGKWFAIQHTAVEPDMVATAKGLAARGQSRPLAQLIEITPSTARHSAGPIR